MLSACPDPALLSLPATWREITPDFFARASDVVAPDLIGKILWRTGVGGGRLTEVEAYLPVGDPASHCFRGETKRNRPMFGPPGCIYVYLSYGVHVCLNVVCDSESVGSAVLIRSFEPLGDTSALCCNRLNEGKATYPSEARVKLKWLACGPGRVGQALGLHLGLDGLPFGAASGIQFYEDGAEPCVEKAARIGVSKGRELPLRFFAAGSPYVTQRGQGRKRE
jgi:DNA-3-methyladenine glycosylase